MMWRHLACSLWSAVTQFSHDRRGASATMVAIALPGLIGFGALGAETGAWYTIKLRNQSAADAAAISATYEVIAGKTNVNGDLIRAASEAAVRNGYTGPTPVVTYPYSDIVVSNGVAVTLQQTQSALLASMFLSGITVTSKAVAVVEVLDNPCILALGPSSTDVEIATSTHLAMPNCSIAANSISRTAVELHDSTSSLAAATLVTAGEVSLQGIPINPAAPPSQFSLGSQARIGSPSVADPYATSLTHTFLTVGPPVMPLKSASGPPYPANSRIRGPLKINSKLDLRPGTYWITDGDLILGSNGVLECTSCNPITGAGVTIILTTAKASGGTVGTVNMLAANATIDNLNAPNSGTFKGLLMVQDSNGLPAGTTIHGPGIFHGGPGQTLNGLVYFPKSSLTFHGDPSATGPKCLLLVINGLNVDANSSLDTAGCASAGLTHLPTVSTVALAE